MACASRLISISGEEWTQVNTHSHAQTREQSVLPRHLDVFMMGNRPRHLFIARNYSITNIKSDVAQNAYELHGLYQRFGAKCQDFSQIMADIRSKKVY
jgi:hypothetical protein